jgi:hypothetical protein
VTSRNRSRSVAGRGKGKSGNREAFRGGSFPALRFEASHKRRQIYRQILCKSENRDMLQARKTVAGHTIHSEFGRADEINDRSLQPLEMIESSPIEFGSIWICLLLFGAVWICLACGRGREGRPSPSRKGRVWPSAERTSRHPTEVQSLREAALLAVPRSQGGAIERMFCRLEPFRRIATRNDRNAVNILAA